MTERPIEAPLPAEPPTEPTLAPDDGYPGTLGWDDECHQRRPRLCNYVDAYYCRTCAAWTEPPCSDPACDFCVDRGESHDPKCSTCDPKAWLAAELAEVFLAGLDEPPNREALFEQRMGLTDDDPDALHDQRAEDSQP